MILQLLMCFVAATSGRYPREAPSIQMKYPIAVNVSAHRHLYKQVAHSIREIDFKNLEYHLLGERIRLRNGSMRGLARPMKGESLSPIHLEVSLRRVWYFDFQANEPRRALLSLDFFSVGASSSDEGFILLFEIADGHPAIVQQLDYDRQAPGTGEDFNAKRGVLTVKARAQDGSSHCCPESLEIDELKWQQQGFKLIHREIVSLSKSGSH